MTASNLSESASGNIDCYVCSIVIPAHNEEGVLPALLEELLDGPAAPGTVELVVSENGSNDATLEIARRYAESSSCVKVVSDRRASYGLALKNGIAAASGRFVVIINADLWCDDFFIESLLRLERGADLVIGSKRLIPSLDHRPYLRRAITQSFNLFLRLFFGFRGTDTHGLKAFRRSAFSSIVRECVTEREVFDTELVLRAQDCALVIREVPVAVFDRRPARLSLMRRVVPTLQDLVTIFLAVRCIRKGATRSRNRMAIMPDNPAFKASE